MEAWIITRKEGTAWQYDRSINAPAVAVPLPLMQGPYQQAKADDGIASGSLQLTRSRALFLYTHIDRREKSKSSSGSSTHTSSSGTTHGGGGGQY